MTRFPIRKRAAAAIVVAAAVLGGAVAAASARSEPAPSYRTATASVRSVDQQIHAVGTVEPVSQASVAFPVAGTVAGVDVTVGEEVSVGSRLATLDLAELEVARNEKQAALDQAELVLQMALDGEDVSGIAGGGAPSGGFGRPAASSDAELEAAQQAVVDAQEAVDEATAAAALAFENAVAVCAAVAPTGDAEQADAAAAATGDDACFAALQAVLAAQAEVTAAQEQLAAAAEGLTTLLEERAGEPGATTTTTTTPSSPSIPEGDDGSSPLAGGGTLPGGSSGSDGQPSGSTADLGGATESSSPSAEDLIAYQKAVDAAEDELAVAQQAIDQATIVSPIDGRVATVGLAAGDEVEAASSTASIVVVGDGGFEVSTSVSVKDLPDLEVGQPAQVIPDGASDPVAGEIVRIGITPDTSGSTATYTVTIGLTGDTSTMRNGSTASVVIVTSAAEEALAVPTSAVTVDGDRSSVRVVSDGAAEEVEVDTGAVGATWTEILDGVEEGDEVVLADLDEPLPGSATDTSSSGQGSLPGGGTFTFPGGGGGFPGGGVRPGG